MLALSNTDRSSLSEREHRELEIAVLLRGRVVHNRSYGMALNPRRRAMKVLMNHYGLITGRSKRNLRKFLTYKNKQNDSITG